MTPPLRMLARDSLSRRIPWARLGDFPTPLQASDNGQYIKRDDLSHPIYGGNKVRCLEPLLGAAAAYGAGEIVAVGGTGSNHALATAVHAPRLGLRTSAVLFRQPWLPDAATNFAAMKRLGMRITIVSSPLLLPVAQRLQKLRRGVFVMPPGGSTPRGALGGLLAGLEIAEQLEALPARIIVLPLGSGCTTAGLLAGLWLAQKWRLIDTRVVVHAVRISPWPIASRRALLRLATSALRELRRALGISLPPVDDREIGAALHIVGDRLGPGYGRRQVDAMRARAEWSHFELDDIYSSKAAAHLQRIDKPAVFWMTKSWGPSST